MVTEIGEFLCPSFHLHLIPTLPFHRWASEVSSSIFEFGHIHCCKQGYMSKIINRMANSVYPGAMAHYHLVLHCLQGYPF